MCLYEYFNFHVQIFELLLRLLQWLLTVFIAKHEACSPLSCGKFVLLKRIKDMRHISQFFIILFITLDVWPTCKYDLFIEILWNLSLETGTDKMSALYWQELEESIRFIISDKYSLFSLSLCSNLDFSFYFLFGITFLFFSINLLSLSFCPPSYSQNAMQLVQLGSLSYSPAEGWL